MRKRGRVVVYGLLAVTTTAVAVTLWNTPRESTAAPGEGREPEPGIIALPMNQNGPAGMERLVPELDIMSSYTTAAKRTAVPYMEVFTDGTVAGAAGPPPGLMAKTTRPLPDGTTTILGVEAGSGDTVQVTVDAAGDVVSRVPRPGRGLLSANTATSLLQHRIKHGPGDGGTTKLVLDPVGPGRDRQVAETTMPVYGGDIEGSKLAFAGVSSAADAPQAGQACLVEAVDLDARDTDRLSRRTIPECDEISQVNVSPDGRHVAVSYIRFGETPEIRLAIFEHRRLANVSDTKVSIPTDCNECQYPAQLGYLGMAWIDDATLHVARMKPVPLYLPERDAASILERQLLLEKIHVPARLP
jgi:hypothetical protein